MGQTLQSDNRPIHSIYQKRANVTQFSVFEPLRVCPAVHFYRLQRIFFIQTEAQIQTIYKCGPLYTIHLQLLKRTVKRDKAIFIKISDEYAYAYKHRKLQRADKIKPERILFKKRMYFQAEQEILKSQQELTKNNQSSQLNFQNSNKTLPNVGTNQKDSMLKRFAQVKLLSLFGIGPKLGRIEEDADGLITEEYIEHFSEITIEKIENCIAKDSELKVFTKRLTDLNFKIELPPRSAQNLLQINPQNGVSSSLEQNLHILSYSRWQKGYVLRLKHFHDPKKKPETNSNNNSYENRSINYLVSKFQTEINMAIMDLNNETKMLSVINNLIIQKDLDRAMLKFQENLQVIEDEDEREDYVDQVSSMVASSTKDLGRDYERKIQNIVSSSRENSLANDSVSLSDSKTVNSDNLTTERQLRNHTPLRKKGKLTIDEKVSDVNSDKSYQTDTLSFNKEEMVSPLNKKSQKKSLKLRAEKRNQSLSKEKSQKKGLINQRNQKDLIRQKKVPLSAPQRKQIFEQAYRSLKNAILDKNKEAVNDNLSKMHESKHLSKIEVQICFANTLMQNGKSRHALAIMERMLYFSNEALSSKQLYHYHEIAIKCGVICYTRCAYGKSLKAFERALSILIKLRHYSLKMMNAHNNISCLFHVLKDYDRSLLHLHRGFKIGEYSADYEFLMRSNMAMSLAQKGRVKEAKLEMLKTNKIVQPVNNMVVFCKFYSNLAYLQLLDGSESKSLEKAISHFEEACSIEDKFLIPNGHRPSIFLHNNISMLHYKRRQWKKAKIHCEKILNELNEISGIVAVKVHFNIAKIFSQGYNIDLPEKHFQEAKVLLHKVNENSEKPGVVRRYRQLIQRELNDLEKMKIQEVSEEESYHRVSYMSSSLVKKK